MDISSIQGPKAYTANRPPAEDTLVQDQNRQAAETDLNKENTQAAQQAFKVDITQEAMDAAETNNDLQARPVESSQPREQNQGTGNQQLVSQIVDIVA